MDGPGEGFQEGEKCAGDCISQRWMGGLWEPAWRLGHYSKPSSSRFLPDLRREQGVGAQRGLAFFMFPCFQEIVLTDKKRSTFENCCNSHFLFSFKLVVLCGRPNLHVTESFPSWVIEGIWQQLCQTALPFLGNCVLVHGWSYAHLFLCNLTPCPV